MKLTEKIKNILAAQAAIFILMVVVFTIMGYAFQSDEFKMVSTDSKVASLPLFLYGCIIAPLFEEMFFRVLPFMFIRNSPNFERLKYPVLILSAAIFGYMHGSFFNVYFQGLGGLILGWVYLKNGLSYWSSVIVHFSWNFLLMVVLPFMLYHPHPFAGF